VDGLVIIAARKWINMDVKHTHNKALQPDSELPPINRTHFSNLKKEVSNAEIQQSEEDLAVYKRV
jgi:hypothetical protein